MTPARIAQVAQVARVVKSHPARALHDWLDNDGGQFVSVLRELCLESRTVCRVVVRRHLRREFLEALQQVQ